jgi:pantetheine-phosphate adenylyltransferase
VPSREENWAVYNGTIAGSCGTTALFMSTSSVWSCVASSLVKEIATYGGDIAHLLPPTVHRRLMERIAERA